MRAGPACAWPRGAAWRRHAAGRPRLRALRGARLCPARRLPAAPHPACMGAPWPPPPNRTASLMSSTPSASSTAPPPPPSLTRSRRQVGLFSNRKRVGAGFKSTCWFAAWRVGPAACGADRAATSLPLPLPCPPAERYEQDSIDMAAASDKGEAEGGLQQAQASLLDLGDGADGGGPTPSSASAAAAASGGGAFGGLADLMSLGGAPTPAAAAAVPASPADLLGDLMGGPAPAPAQPPAAAPAAAPQAAGGLGGLEDLLGGLGGGAPAAAPAAPAAGVSLLAQPQISPQDFQRSWAAWTPGARSFQQPLSGAAVAAVEANGYRVRLAVGAWGSGAGCGWLPLQWIGRHVLVCCRALTLPHTDHPLHPLAGCPPTGLHRAHRAGPCGELCHAARGVGAALPLPLPRPGRRQRRARAGAGHRQHGAASGCGGGQVGRCGGSGARGGAAADPAADAVALACGGMHWRGVHMPRLAPPAAAVVSQRRTPVNLVCLDNGAGAQRTEHGASQMACGR